MFKWAPTQRVVEPDLRLDQDESPNDVAIPPDFPPRAFSGSVSDRAFEDPMQLPSDHAFGLGQLRSALGRGRRYWLTAAIAGLAIGSLYHTVVPLKYWASSTVYIADPSNSSPTLTAQNDVAILDTNAVADRALARLREPGLTAAGLLGKDPGTLVSQNVLEISASGPSPKVSVRRVDALTSAYLSFQARQYDQQNRVLVAATRKELAKIQSEVRSLSSKIGAGSSSTGRAVVLEARRTALLSQITNLDAAIQQDNENQLAVTSGSKVLSWGAAVPGSKKKVLLFDGLTGLVAGLGLGIIAVVMFDMLSDRVRRRDEVAELVNAPVTVSVGRVASHWPRSRSAAEMMASPSRELQFLARGLRSELRFGESCLTELLVAIDDTLAPAAALMMVAAEVTREGKRAVLVDLTDHRVLGRPVGCESVGVHAFNLGDQSSTLVVPALPKQTHDPRGWNREVHYLSPDVVLLLATVDPAVGASHLKQWNREAVVTVAAGRSSAQRVAATSELLHAAGILIASAALLDAEPKDNSVGLPTMYARLDDRRASTVRGPLQVPDPTVT